MRFKVQTHSRAALRFATSRRGGTGAAAVLLTLATPLASSAAMADEGAEPDYLAQLKQCRELVDPTARLACFDGAVAVMVTATESGEIQIVDREAVRETRRGLFGFSLPKLGIFGGNDDDDELERKMQSEITGVRRIDGDSWVIKIEEGSVWQISDAHRGFKPRPGAPVEIERATMGSYWIRVDGQIGVKGRRVE